MRCTDDGGGVLGVGTIRVVIGGERQVVGGGERMLGGQVVLGVWVRKRCRGWWGSERGS